jgi:hypothetical protein
MSVLCTAILGVRGIVKMAVAVLSFPLSIIIEAINGLLHQPWMMSVDQSVDCFTGEIEILGENLPQCHSVHNKCHMTWRGLQPWTPWWEASD